MNEKYKRLVEFLKDLPSLAISFSGGTDSSFLLAVAKESVKNLIAVTSASPIHKKRRIEEAKKIAEFLKVRHILFDPGELSIENFLENREDRCYICKKNLFTKIKKIASEYGIFHVADGTILDDLKEFRPGRMAAQQLGVMSPLLEVGFKKDEIRAFLKKMGFPFWNKPSESCLATRIPYGERITEEKLRIIEKAEDILEDMGFRIFRVKVYGDMAKIKVSESEIEELFRKRGYILERFKMIGFSYVSLDLEGFRKNGGYCKKDKA